MNPTPFCAEKGKTLESGNSKRRLSARHEPQLPFDNKWKDFVQKFLIAEPGEILVPREVFKKRLHDLYLAKQGKKAVNL